MEHNISQTDVVNAIHAQPHPSQQYANASTLSTIDPIDHYTRPAIPYQLGSYSYSSDCFREHYFVQDQGTFPTSNPPVQVPHPYYPHQPPAQIRHDSSVSPSESDHAAAEDLSEALGELKIAEIGIGKTANSVSFATADDSLSTLHKTAREE